VFFLERKGMMKILDQVGIANFYGRLGMITLPLRRSSSEQGSSTILVIPHFGFHQNVERLLLTTGNFDIFVARLKQAK